MREHKTVNKRATTAKLIACAVTILGIVLAWAASESINVWDGGIWSGLRSYLIAIIIASTPIRWNYFDRWGGINYCRTLSAFFSLRAAIDVVIVCIWHGYAAAFIIASLICIFFAYIRFGSLKRVKELRIEEEELEEHRLYAC